jgi:hypothetical protein
MSSRRPRPFSIDADGQANAGATASKAATSELGRRRFLLLALASILGGGAFYGWIIRGMPIENKKSSGVETISPTMTPSSQPTFEPVNAYANVPARIYYAVNVNETE